MSLKSSTFNSKVGFDHKTLLCMSPPAAVTGAPLPMTDKGQRNSTSRQERKAQIKVPNINLKNIIRPKEAGSQVHSFEYGVPQKPADDGKRLKTPSPAPSKTTNNTSMKQSLIHTDIGQSRNQDSTFISCQLTPNTKDPIAHRKITIEGGVPRLKVIRPMQSKDFFT